MKLRYFGLLRECQKSASLNLPRISTAIEQAGLEQQVTAHGQPVDTPLRIYTHVDKTGNALVASSAGLRQRWGMLVLCSFFSGRKLGSERSGSIPKEMHFPSDQLPAIATI